MDETQLDPPGRMPAPDAVSMAVFRRLLVNTLAPGVTSSFLWFALTFWVYLETRSVVATGVIGGAFSISSALTGPFFGTFADRHRKHTAMMLSTAVSTLCFAVATSVFVAVDAGDLLRLRSPWFWLLIGFTLLGSVAGQMRSIALSTCVTLLVPEESRDRANGMVGTITGVSFAITSVFSGLVIGQLGMGWAYYGSLALTIVALVHLRSIHISEARPVDTGPADGPKHIDVRAGDRAVAAVACGGDPRPVDRLQAPAAVRPARKSGSIEQDADLVAFIFREEYYDKETERAGIADIIIAKHRNGAIGEVELTFAKEYPKFLNYTSPDRYA